MSGCDLIYLSFINTMVAFLHIVAFFIKLSSQSESLFEQVNTPI